MSENPVFQLFEDTCPGCGADVKITSMGGTWRFREEQGSLAQGAGVKFGLWGAQQPGRPVGGIGWKCEGCGATYYAEQYPDGDWAA
jgi:hypothetical protein